MEKRTGRRAPTPQARTWKCRPRGSPRGARRGKLARPACSLARPGHVWPEFRTPATSRHAWRSPNANPLHPMRQVKQSQAERSPRRGVGASHGHVNCHRRPNRGRAQFLAAPWCRSPLRRARRCCSLPFRLPLPSPQLAPSKLAQPQPSCRRPKRSYAPPSPPRHAPSRLAGENSATGRGSHPARHVTRGGPE